VCRKCAVRFDPMCAKALLFNTRADCFRAGLVVGKLLMFNDVQTRKTLSDSPTLNQSVEGSIPSALTMSFPLSQQAVLGLKFICKKAPSRIGLEM